MARYLVTFLPGSVIPTRTKWVDDASGPPDADVDAGTDGVAFGSILWDGEDLWFCVDPTTAAAVWVQINGGGAGDIQTLHVESSVSGAYTADRDDGWTHDITLDGDVTITPAATTFEPGEAIDLRLIIHPAGNDVAWGGSIDWATHDGNPPEVPTDIDAVMTVGLVSLDDAASWRGYAGGSSALATIVESETTYGIAPAVGTGTKSARDDHTHGSPPQPPVYVGPILVVSEPAGSPLVFADLLQNSEGTDLLYASEA